MASGASNSSLVGYLSQLDLSKLPNDIYTKRIVDDFKLHLKILELKINNYDKLFNYTKYANSKIKALEKQIGDLSASGVSNNNERIIKLKKNKNNTRKNYEITKGILNSPNISPKMVTMDSFIKTLTELSDAITDIYKDIAKLPADKIFKSSFFGNSAAKKQEKFLQDLLNMSASIKTEKNKFIKLKQALVDAESAQKAGESADKLQARLAKLKGDFNSASSLPIAGLSNPQQRNSITKAIANIQRKINTTVKGGATRKRRHSRRRHTRRN